MTRGKRGEQEKTGGDQIAFHPAHFEEFLKGIEQVSRASQKIMETSKNLADVRDLLGAEERFDDLPVKPFGDGGSHIVVRGSQHIGKKTKVIIKRR